MGKIKVTLGSNKGRKVAVNVSSSDDGLGVYGLPPHTARSQPVACIDRGDNVHGSLEESFYLVSNSSDEPSHFILWLADDGSQEEDDQARLTPVAWADCEDFWDEEEGEFKEDEAAVVLLYAWIKHAEESSSWYGEAEVGSETCTLDDEEIARIMELARSGKPLSLRSK